MERLSLRHVYKMYLDGCAAVFVVSADVEPAEIFFLLGPSRAGKTSLLRMIAGTESVTRGQILWGNDPINDLPPKQRPVQMLASDYSLYPYLTVYENIAFRLKLAHYPSPVIRKTVRETAQALGILHLLDRLPRALTLPEKLFTALGRLLVRQPKLLLLDDPMARFSARMREFAMQKLMQIQTRLDIPFVYSTADVHQVEIAGGRALLMMDGNAVQCGTVEELRRCPVNLKAARFLSHPSLNVCDVQLDMLSEKEAVLYFGKEQSPALPVHWENVPPALRTRPQPDPLTAGVYPQRLRCTQEHGVEGTLRGVVSGCFESGGNTYVRFKNGGMEWTGLLEPGTRLPMAGERVTGLLQLSEVLLFDKASEIAL